MPRPGEIEERELPPPSLDDVQEVPDPFERDEPALDEDDLLGDEDVWPGEVPDDLKEHR